MTQRFNIVRLAFALAMITVIVGAVWNVLAFVNPTSVSWLFTARAPLAPLQPVGAPLTRPVEPPPSIPRFEMTSIDVCQMCDMLARGRNRDAELTDSSPTAGPLTSNQDNYRPEQQHWAFIKPVAQRSPVVHQSGWSANPIDDFVLGRLEQEGLRPSLLADREKLIRRLSLDLIGLPPNWKEVEAFLADESPDAYERLMDRLMASPHFGEKWAIHWLDLARYADSNGFEFDAERVMWLYRDWVIGAINADLPFDQFTVEQIAGDLLPNATISQQVATGFLRSSAVATDVANHRFDMLVDRINTVGTTWLGLTFGCAQCHDHTFDPIKQKEFYQLYAIFNNSNDEVTNGSFNGPMIATRSPLNGISAETYVVSERSDPAESFLKVRGSATENGERVEPAVPAFLHPQRSDRNDRLSLACWLIDSNNPLTARVTVNRFWESVFGIGLVRTGDDFGARGEPPTHPELLDWLAVDFQSRGWGSKRTLRQILGSETYKQTANASAELRERDPNNRLLARGPRFRVDAELIRDIALTASGLLSENLGGPSVFPWQPPGTSEKLEFAALSWRLATDENRYRRGFYTFWKRTALYPSFAAFDAPNRTATCAKRAPSTSPQQALVTLNDPVYFEAAVHLGRRMLEEGNGDPVQALTGGFRHCVSRSPSNEEVATLKQFLESELSRLGQDPVTAKDILGGRQFIDAYSDRDFSEWAAYSMLANVLLNLDETITKE